MLLTTFQANIEKLSAWERKCSIDRKCKEGGNEKEHDPPGDDDDAKSGESFELGVELFNTSRKMCQDIQSSSSFVYTRKTTYEGQRALLDFWGFLLKHEDKLNSESISNHRAGTETKSSARHQQLFLDTMKALTLRDEFDLAQLRNKSRGEGAGPTPISQEDKDVFNKYRILLQRTIEMAVRIFLSEKLIQEERMFCLELLAISFFRIPTLCGFLLDSADEEQEEDGEQERGQGEEKQPKDGKDDRKGELSASGRIIEAFKQYKEKAKAEDRKFFSFFENNPSLFDWTVWLQGVNDDWLKSSITKVKIKLSRPENFFPFVSFIICHVCKIAVGQIHFGLVPGYWTLVAAVLERVSRRRAAAYTETMVQCISDLLQNRSLLRFFAQALLLTTDAFDCASVDKSLNLLDEWFLIVAPDMADPLPGNMCFDTLFGALDVLLQSNHFQVLLKTLTFIYMHLGRAYGALRTRFCGLLLDKHFSALFLHWHPEVRLMFHRILIFRLNRLGIKQAGTDKQDKAMGPSASFEHQLLHKVQQVMELDTSSSDPTTAVGEGEDPLTQKKSSSEGGGGDSKQATATKNGGGETVHVQNRMVQDPSLKHCACVFAPLNNSQLQVDIKLHETLLKRLTELQQINQKSPVEKKSDVAGGAAAAAGGGTRTSPSIASSLEMNLPAALFEFRNVSRSFSRLQESVADLQPYEVITPEYHFDILPSL